MSESKRIAGLTMLLLCSMTAFGQHDVSSCEASPDFCKTKIVPLTDKEKADLKAASDTYDAAEKKLRDLADKYNAVLDAAIRNHNMRYLRAIAPVKFGNGAYLMGATCTGKIEVNQDGYLVYTPPADAYSCYQPRKSEPTHAQ